MRERNHCTYCNGSDCALALLVRTAVLTGLNPSYTGREKIRPHKNYTKECATADLWGDMHIIQHKLAAMLVCIWHPDDGAPLLYFLKKIKKIRCRFVKCVTALRRSTIQKQPSFAQSFFWGCHHVTTTSTLTRALPLSIIITRCYMDMLLKINAIHSSTETYRMLFIKELPS